jgi:anti-sigma factor ChrR (cupin superfamily)
MITEQQQEQAALYALSLLSAEEDARFAAQVRADAELRELVISFQRSMAKVALAAPAATPPPSLKDEVFRRIQAAQIDRAAGAADQQSETMPGLRFVASTEPHGWKQLPVPGAWLKLLSIEPNRGYAVLMGKLEPGARYPAHANVGPEDFCVLTGDLHVGARVLGPGDFHHADAGSFHTENYSVEGCTLLAVLTVDDPLVAFAMA